MSFLRRIELGDLRFALRYFARHKAATAIIVAVLALGTGANTVIFSLFQAEFLRPGPAVPDDEALVRLWGRERPTLTASWQPRLFSHAELTALASRRETFDDVAGWTDGEIIVRGHDTTGAIGAHAQFVTPNFFRALGVRLAAGQGLRDATGDEPDLTAVMAFTIAERLQGGAAAAVGQTVLVNEIPVTVVGVAPPRFQGALRNMEEPVLWMPLSARATVGRLSPRWLADSAALSLFARLAPGTPRQAATAVVRQVSARSLPESATRAGMARTADALRLPAIPPGSGRSEAALAFTAMAAVGVLILLVAWMNVSSLMIVSAVGRRHEIAVRLALGASRLRLLRQLVTESTGLALAGSGLGLLLAWWALTYLARTQIDGVDIAPDAGTFLFALAMAATTGILFGLSPALHATHGTVANAMRDSGTGSTRRSRLQQAFVVAQIALSQPLLMLLGATIALVIADYRPLSPVMSQRVISVGIRPLPGAAPDQRPASVDSLVRRIAERSEVRGAVPASDAFDLRRVAADGPVPDAGLTIVNVEGAAPGWFGVVDVPIILGRDVSLADTAAADYPVVIGTDLARALWGETSPLGRTLASPGLDGFGQDSMAMTVVGVYDASRRLPGMAWNGGAVRAGVNDVTHRVFTARGKAWRRDLLLVRTHGLAAPWVPELYRFIREAAPSLPVTSMRTLAQADEAEYRMTLRASATAGAAGAVALLLASLGLYGVVALAVRQRTREIGIRLAVGATPRTITRAFLASGVRVSLLALAIGLPVSFVALKVGVTRALVIEPRFGSWVLGLVIAPLMMAVAVAATWGPARRAARIDPARTLRVDHVAGR